MSVFFKNRDSQTPLEENLRDELKFPLIQNMTELYEHELENIAMGIPWKNVGKKDHTDQSVWLAYHKHLLGEVWKFAGTVRKSDLANEEFMKAYDVRVGLRNLQDDLRCWLGHSSFPPQKMMAIFHQRLLTIHPFRDGNGRWSRLLTNWICEKESFPIPSWGQKIADDEERRVSYIKAVKKSRTGDHRDLISFMFEDH